MDMNTGGSASRDDIRVLVVDNNKMLREALAELMGYLPGLRCVGTAATGAEAIRLTRSQCPDAILVDSRVPDMDAAEVIAQVREAYAPVRIVGYSIQPGDGVRGAFLQAGADEFVDKGGGIDELVAAIRKLGLVPEPHRSLCEERSRNVA